VLDREGAPGGPAGGVLRLPRPRAARACPPAAASRCLREGGTVAPRPRARGRRGVRAAEAGLRGLPWIGQASRRRDRILRAVRVRDAEAGGARREAPDAGGGLSASSVAARIRDRCASASGDCASVEGTRPAHGIVRRPPASIRIAHARAASAPLPLDRAAARAGTRALQGSAGVGSHRSAAAIPGGWPIGGDHSRAARRKFIKPLRKLRLQDPWG